MKKVYEFLNVKTGEVVWYARVKGEYREQNEHNIWRDNARLYPYLRITSLKQLVLEMSELGFYISDIYNVSMDF